MQYVSFSNVDASSYNGKPIDGGTGCVDGGNNVNINFSGVKMWDGGGADSNWSTAANWSGDTVPVAGQDVIFDSTSGNDCTIDTNISVAGFYIRGDYAGTVSGGSATIEVTLSNFDDSEGQFSAGTSTLRFTGSGYQKILYPRYETFYVIENAKTASTLEFYQLRMSLNTLKAGPGTTTLLNHENTYVTNLDLQGTSGSLITINSRSGCSNIAALSLSGAQTVAYVDFANIDASDNNGKPIDGSVGCVDSGNNTNINFNGVKTWDGGGADNNWSTAANWSGDTVPGSSQAVIFDVTSGKDCVIDSNVTVASVRVGSDYTGTLQGGSSTLTLASGHFYSPEGQFQAQTSTLRFTGSGYQKLTYPRGETFYVVENAQNGGTLEFVMYSVTLHTLKTGANCTTKLSHETTTVTNLDIQGSSASLSVIRSRSGASNPAGVHFLGAQTIEYASFYAVQASLTSGKAIDATLNCTDSGDNSGIYFSALKRWDGGGADNNLTTPANWVNDIAPVAGDSLFFDELSTKQCVVDANSQVTNILMYSGYAGGELNFGSSTSSVAGSITQRGGEIDLSSAELSLSKNWTFDDGSVTGGTSTLRLVGTTAQTLDLPDGVALGDVSVENTTSVSFVAGFSAGTVSAVPGSLIYFPANKTVQAAVLDFPGTEAAPIVLTSTSAPTAWKLNHTGTQNDQTISWVHVGHSNASLGTTIDATDASLDLGNNTNWTFSAAGGITLPAASAVSPLCVEGRVQGGGSTAVTVERNGTGTNAEFIDSTLWFVNVALDDSSAVTINVKDDGSSILSQSVSWSSTDIVSQSEIAIRDDDSLLLTATGTGTTLTIDADGDASVDFTGAPGDTYAFQYTAPGTYTAEAKIDGNPAGTLTVKVLSADLGSRRLGCWKGHSVPRTVSVSPSASFEDVWFGPSNDAHMYVSTSSTTTGSKTLALSIYALNPEKSLVARVGDHAGSILTYKKADCFNLNWVSLGDLPVMQVYPDDDTLVASTITMSPHFDDVSVKFNVFSGGALFENGSSEVTFESDDFDANGQFNYYLTLPAGGKVCHRMSITE